MDNTILVKIENEMFSHYLPNNFVGNDIKFLPESEIKEEVENNSDLGTLALDNENFKIEIDEKDMKKECFGDMNEVLLEYKNPSISTADGEKLEPEFDFVDINNIIEKELTPEENPLENLLGDSSVVGNGRREYKFLYTNEYIIKAGLVKKYEQKRLKCDVCQKTYASKSVLTQHKRIHTGEKPFSCDICEKAFSEKTYLNKHKRIHTRENSYTCEVCKEHFLEKSHFITHKFTHSGEKPFSCEVCKRLFAKKSILDKHNSIHTREKPYKCEICQQSFKREAHLNIHIQRRHTETYSCDLCQKPFTHKQALIIHKRFHTDKELHSCNVCKKSFHHILELQTHKCMHTEEKLNTCKVCNTLFEKSSDLYRHICPAAADRTIEVPTLL